MPIDASDIVAGIAVLVSIIAGVLNSRARVRHDQRQEQVNAVAREQGFAKLLEDDNTGLRSEVAGLRSEVAELRHALGERREEHHKCLQEVQAVRLHLLLIARAIPAELVPEELTNYIRSLQEDP